MSRPVHETSTPPAPEVQDWFLPAILSDGSVDHSLGVLMADLDYKHRFVEILRQHLAPRPVDSGDGPALVRSQDALTELGARAKNLAHTLEHRLGMLSAERRAAWFRAPIVGSGGPFTRVSLPVPVLGSYQGHDAAKVRAGLYSAYWAPSLQLLPFAANPASLWSLLIGMRQDLDRIECLPPPYAPHRLSEAPQQLAAVLHSPACLAFLDKLRQVIIATRQSLDASFAKLQGKCEELWTLEMRQAEGHARRPTHPGAAQAEEVRDRLRARRLSLRQMASAKDQAALRLLGFHDLPSARDLRARYLELAKKLHPDRNGGEDQAFKDLQAAYDRVLSRIDASTGPFTGV